MAYPIFATSQVLEVGPTNNYYVAGIKDANGHLAAATTQYDLLPSGLLLPRQVDQNGIPLTASRVTTQITDAPLAASAPYEQAWQDSEALAVTFVGGSVYADQAGTLYIDFSNDDTNTAGTSATSLAFTPASAGTPDSNMLPYPVEIPTRYFRFRYVNGSTAQSVFQLYQTPMAQWSPRTVGLSGSLAPLNADPPRLIAAIPYTDFGTSASTGQNDFARVLTRNARHRTFSAVNALNQAVSADDVYLWDSSIKPGGAPADLVGSGINIGQANSTAGIMAADDAEFPVLGRSVDSLSISLTAAANPTSGSFYLYVTELI